MSQDLYELLGVARTSSADEIKKAYRKLAATLHPDKNPGNKGLETRFKRVNAAYQVLGDPKRRALYDEFGEASLSEGFDADKARAYKRWAGGGSRRTNPPGGGGGEWDDLFAGRGGGGISDIMSELFGRRGRGAPVKGADIESEISISFVDAVMGATLALRWDATGEVLQVRIPKGATEGSRLRIAGKGQPSPMAGGTVGDLILTVHVTPHRWFRMEGDDLHLELPITVAEAYLGGKVRVPTPEGEVVLKVPKGAQSGQVVRLKGKGISRKGHEGDLFVRFLVHVPTEDTASIRDAIRAMDQVQRGDDLRADISLDRNGSNGTS